MTENIRTIPTESNVQTTQGAAPRLTLADLHASLSRETRLTRIVVLLELAQMEMDSLSESLAQIPPQNRDLSIRTTMGMASQLDRLVVTLMGWLDREKART